VVRNISSAEVEVTIDDKEYENGTDDSIAAQPIQILKIKRSED